ncbi:MAG: hypothetical protein QM796_22695 [Chthoniobacteraceae bacterium]
MKRAITLFLLGCAFAQAEPLADQVSGLNFPGRGQFGECVEFADALSTWLQNQGQSSQVIYYTYRPGLLHHPVTHAIVAWQRDGQWWGMGNELPRPRALGFERGGAPINLAQNYDSRAYAAVTRTTQMGLAIHNLSLAAGAIGTARPQLAVVAPAKPKAMPEPAKVEVAEVTPPTMGSPVTPVSQMPVSTAFVSSSAQSVSRPVIQVQPSRRFYTDSNGTQILIQ